MLEVTGLIRKWCVMAIDQEMVRDGNWVTSRSPKDLAVFNPAMVSLFAESKTKAPQR